MHQFQNRALLFGPAWNLFVEYDGGGAEDGLAAFHAAEDEAAVAPRIKLFPGFAGGPKDDALRADLLRPPDEGADDEGFIGNVGLAGEQGDVVEGAFDLGGVVEDFNVLAGGTHDGIVGGDFDAEAVADGLGGVGIGGGAGAAGGEQEQELEE